MMLNQYQGDGSAVGYLGGVASTDFATGAPTAPAAWHSSNTAQGERRAFRIGAGCQPVPNRVNRIQF